MSGVRIYRSQAVAKDHGTLSVEGLTEGDDHEMRNPARDEGDEGGRREKTGLCMVGSAEASIIFRK